MKNVPITGKHAPNTWREFHAPRESSMRIGHGFVLSPIRLTHC